MFFFYIFGIYIKYIFEMFCGYLFIYMRIFIKEVIYIENLIEINSFICFVVISM